MDALILAGGKSRRMGGLHKGSLTLGDESFTQHLINELKAQTQCIYLSYGSTIQREYTDCCVIQDEYADCGPMGGLHAGLKVCNNILLTAACDMPLLRWELYEFLLSMLDGYDAVIPIAEGKTQPLAAVYTKAMLPIFEEHLQNGDYRLMKALQQAHVCYVDVPQFAYMMKNINTEAEYAELLADPTRRK